MVQANSAFIKRESVSWIGKLVKSDDGFPCPCQHRSRPGGTHQRVGRPGRPRRARSPPDHRRPGIAVAWCPQKPGRAIGWLTLARSEAYSRRRSWGVGSPQRQDVRGTSRYSLEQMLDVGTQCLAMGVDRITAGGLVVQNFTTRWVNSN